jgi:SAM-dependent methyltransferase
MTASVEKADIDACPLCGSRAFTVEHAAVTDRHGQAGGGWSFRRCVSCRAIYLHPRPADLGAAYPPDYAQHERRTAPRIASGHGQGLFRLQRTWIREAVLAAEGYEVGRSRIQESLGRILGRVPTMRLRAHGGYTLLPPGPPGALLDFGCGNGGLLSFARLLGWDVVGVERDPTSAAQAREVSAAPVYPSIDDAGVADGSLDVVTMNHSLEHTEDPTSVVARSRRLLKPGGRLGIAVPNWNALAHRLLGVEWPGLEPSRHLVMFDRARLRRLLEDQGFRVDSLTTTSTRRLLDRGWPGRVGARRSAAEGRVWRTLGWLANAASRGWGEEIIAWSRRAAG